MANAPTLHKVDFTFVRQRDENAETKWKVETSHAPTPAIEGFDELDVITNASDAFNRRMVVVICVPGDKLAAVVDAGQELGGFLDMRGAELRRELVRRIHAAIGWLGTDGDGDQE